MPLVSDAILRFKETEWDSEKNIKYSCLLCRLPLCPVQGLAFNIYDINVLKQTYKLGNVFYDFNPCNDCHVWLTLISYRP